MRFHSLFLATFVLPFTALAATPDPSSVFAKLRRLYDAGTTPDFDGRGFVGFAGRCFSPTEANAIKGGAYFVQEDDGGDKSAMSIWSDDLSYYDDLHTDRVLRTGPNWHPAEIARRSLRTTLGTGYASFLRRSGDSYVEKLASLDGRDVGYMCYYSIALEP